MRALVALTLMLASPALGMGWFPSPPVPKRLAMIPMEATCLTPIPTPTPTDPTPTWPELLVVINGSVVTNFGKVEPGTGVYVLGDEGPYLRLRCPGNQLSGRAVDAKGRGYSLTSVRDLTL